MEIASAFSELAAIALLNSRNLEAHQKIEEELRKNNEELRCTEEELRSANEELQVANEALVISGAERQSILDTAMDGFWITDLSEKFLEVNDAYCATSGYTRKELLKMGVCDVEVELQEETNARIRRIISSGSERFATRHRRKNGSLVDLEISVNYLPGEYGKFFVFMRDITERVQAAEALAKRDAELRFRNRVAEIFLAYTDDRMFLDVLQVVRETMQSRFGLFGYFTEHGDLVIPSMTEDVWEQCRVFDKRQIVAREKTTSLAWTKAAREKRTICVNEPHGGTPAGHLPILCYLSLPVMFQDRVIGLLQVANKEGGYSADDVRSMEAITAYLAPLLNARLERVRTEELVANILESIDEGFVVVDRDYRIISANRAFAERLSLPLGEVIGRHCHAVSHNSATPCEGEEHPCTVRQVFASGISSTAVHTHYDANGHPFYVETKAFPLARDERGQVQTAIEIVIDITEKRAREAEIQQLAFYDPLTSLPNRRLLQDRLEQACLAGARSGQHGALLFLDLDHFKTINDTQGHDAGDLLLVEVARRLLESVRDGDTVSRQGGDEFVVLLKNLAGNAANAVSQAGHVAEKIRRQLARPYAILDHTYHCSASLGACLFLGSEASREELFKHADIALYQAKTGGRNTVRFYDPAMQAALEISSALEADLRLAIERGQLQLYYQAKVDQQQRIVGAEALLRWFHPERGTVSPATFIPIAEDSGLIRPIGHWVLETACLQLKEWTGMSGACELKLAVNISARQFHHLAFVEEVMQVIDEHGIDPARLIIELTESVMLNKEEETIRRINTLKALGFGFSMDDFGTGYSSLSLLKRLPLDEIKIDQSFIRDLGRDPHDAAIVATIIAMGRTLGMGVVAEGVETDEQQEFLITHGCHTFQGYLFARPLPATEFAGLLRKSEKRQLGTLLRKAIGDALK